MIRDWAECSFSRTPVPDCALSGSVCRDNVVAGCDQGYPVISIYGPVSCGSATCTQHGTCAYCEDGTSAPDPACAAGARDTCGGTLTYTCECGRRARPGYDCSDAGAVCVHTGKSGPLGEAASKTFCSVTGQPDPGCGDAGSDWVQTDAGLISCCQGYAVAARSACP
jgi:hypothetical protein